MKSKYDFYYSKKHRNYLIEMAELFPFDSLKQNYVNGLKYTEMIEKGHKPVTNHFGDLQMVFSGSDYVITRLNQ